MEHIPTNFPLLFRHISVPHSALFYYSEYLPRLVYPYSALAKFLILLRVTKTRQDSLLVRFTPTKLHLHFSLTTTRFNFVKIEMISKNYNLQQDLDSKFVRFYWRVQGCVLCHPPIRERTEYWKVLGDRDCV